MKALVLSILFIFSISTFAGKPVSKDGYCNGKKLWGDVLIIDRGTPDFYVYVDYVSENLRVKPVEYLCSKPGEWRFVSKNGPHDFTIKFVDERNHADFTIRIVSNMCGVTHPTEK